MRFYLDDERTVPVGRHRIYWPYEFVCLDKLTYAGNIQTIEPLIEKDNYSFVKGDISDRRFVEELFEKEQFDIVVNFAAESHVDRSILDPGIFLTTNIIGTQVLMDASRTVILEDLTT